MPQDVYHHTFPNGLTLLAERMEHVRSAALNFLVPAGCVYDPPEHAGIASVLSDLITRGAGKRDSRALSLALDNLGLDRDESVGAINMRFWGSTLSRNAPAALEIFADIVRRPHLPEEELEAEVLEEPDRAQHRHTPIERNGHRCTNWRQRSTGIGRRVGPRGVRPPTVSAPVSAPHGRDARRGCRRE